jgi:long-chain-alcohol oxidase
VVRLLVGTMASELVKAGLTVVVLEKGDYFDVSDFSKWGEAEAMENLFDRGGLSATDDGNIICLAGSNVGGGSTLNWSASFRTPDFVRDEWVAMGLKEFRLVVLL